MLRPRLVPDPGGVPAFSERLRQLAQSKWDAVDEQTKKREKALELEVFAPVRSQMGADEYSRLDGSKVFMTTGILHYIVHYGCNAEKLFLQCHKHVYCNDGRELTDDQEQIAKDIFTKLYAIVYNLAFYGRSYSSVGNLHRNRVAVEFLCSLALSGHGTTAEKNAAFSILQSGFCFLTCTFGLYSGPFFNTVLSRSEDDYDTSSRHSKANNPSRQRIRGKMEASYTAEEAAEYSSRRARGHRLKELHHDNRAVCKNTFDDEPEEEQPNIVGNKEHPPYSGWAGSERSPSKKAKQSDSNEDNDTRFAVDERRGEASETGDAPCVLYPTPYDWRKMYEYFPSSDTTPDDFEFDEAGSVVPADDGPRDTSNDFTLRQRGNSVGLPDEEQRDLEDLQRQLFLG
jgi:hypothetical protein